MDLFLDRKELTFEKLALEARMPEDANEWPQKILDQLYQQAPFTSHYSPKVVLREVDPDKRYALGHIELQNKLAINPRDDDTPQKLKGKQKAVVPVIIREGKLSPLDLLMDNGQVEPLTDERLRRALFRPSLFEAIRKRPGDLSMIEQLYPPNRQFGGARGPLITEAGSGEEGTKVSAAHPEFLMDAILPTIKMAHIKEMGEFFRDPVVRAAYADNEVAAPFLNKLAALEQGQIKYAQQTPVDFLKTAAATIKPKVVQIQKIAGGFRIKTADPQMLLPTADDVPREQAVGSLGGDLVSKVEQDGTTTITTQPNVKESLEDIHVQVVDSFGLYKVRTEVDNKELVGWVFPKVMDLTGEVLPLAVFSNGSESAIQENVAGIHLARQSDVIDSPPEGTGMFYMSDKHGSTGIVPVFVRATNDVAEQTEYLCQTMMGEHCTIVKIPGLKTITPISQQRYGLPEDVGFMPLPNMINLASDPASFTKVAEARAYTTAVRVITDGTLYSFEGPLVDKVASALPVKFLELDDAVFLGAVLGADPEKVKTACQKVVSQGHQEFWFEGQPITTVKEKYAEAKKQAQALLDKLPNMRVLLVKEAAPLFDPTSVDKILSLGFLNPENVMIFASYIPEIEDTVHKLAEILLASRLGLTAIDTSALERSLVHLDKVIAGLKTLTDQPQA